MKKRKKGGEKMTTLTLNDIQSRVKRNSEKNSDAIREYKERLRSSSLKQGRVRPRDPDERSILSFFTRK